MLGPEVGGAALGNRCPLRELIGSRAPADHVMDPVHLMQYVEHVRTVT